MARLDVQQQIALLNDPKNPIPWDDFKSWGFTQDMLLAEDLRQEAHGALVNLFVNHGYSPVFKVRPDYRSNDVTFTGEIYGAVRFYVSKGETKKEFLVARPQYRMEDDIYVNEYTCLHANATNPEEKLAHDNLVQTGFANIPVMVRDPRWGSEPGGAVQPCIVAIDMSDDRHRGTNQALYKRVSWLEEKIRKSEGRICGAAVTAEEKKAYLAGQNVFLKGMMFGKTGRTFDAYVRFNPVTGNSVFNSGMAQQQAQTQTRAAEVSRSEQQEVAAAKSRARRR